MKVFVIGSNGYIGKKTIAVFKDNKLRIEAVSSRPSSDMHFLDLTKPENFNFSLINERDIVIFTAALSSPDICKNQYELATKVNVSGTGYFIEHCLKNGAKVAFLSSDTVYGPGESERDENSVCYPVGEYAVMKHEIENRFIDNPDFKTLRLSYVFSRKDKFTNYIATCFDNNNEAEIFHPMFRRAVYLIDLIDLLKTICNSWESIPHRVINVCGPKLLSRVEMADIYKDVAASNFKYKIVKPQADFFLARPQIINMSDRIFNKVLGRPTHSIRDAMLKEFSSNWS